MIFIGEPNLVVIDNNSGQKLFNFDKNGEYETSEENLIKRMKPYFVEKEIKTEEEIKIEVEVVNNEQPIRSSNVKSSNKRLGRKGQ